MLRSRPGKPEFPMKLYYAPGACSLVPHIVLRELGEPFELVRVDLATHRLADGSDYTAINAKGEVPVLELEDGSRLTEGPVICQYLADRAGRRDLMPAAGTMARYRVMEWQNHITSDLHKGFSPLFKPDFDDATKKRFAETLRNRLGWVSQQLGSKAHLTGESFTAADAYLFVMLNWAQYMKLDLGALDALNAFHARVAARPAVREAMQVEGLVK